MGPLLPEPGSEQSEIEAMRVKLGKENLTMVLVRSGLEGVAFIRGLVCCQYGTPEFHRPAHSVAGGAAPPPTSAAGDP